MLRMKFVILLALLAIVVVLASAGVFMLRRPGSEGAQPKRMARALALRVGLSITLFLLVLLAWQMGWIEPRGIPVGR